MPNRKLALSVENGLPGRKRKEKEYPLLVQTPRIELTDHNNYHARLSSLRPTFLFRMKGCLLQQ
jgi:hypothetical protein